jgi:hypothetical protein
VFRKEVLRKVRRGRVKQEVAVAEQWEIQKIYRAMGTAVYGIKMAHRPPENGDEKVNAIKSPEIN